jgi:hypothetical protein
VITVSDGWRLVRPDSSLTRLGACDQDFSPAAVAPGMPVRPNAGPVRGGTGTLLRSCEADRQMLAALDNARAFRDLLDKANRANVSFYPVDPRGLPAFDSSMADTKMSEGGVTQPLLTLTGDRARLAARTETLRTLASATDGVAVVDSNDVDRGLRRIESDMASYYLLGYYSTNTKLDGRFRAITVRSTRPGVQVRARRGYLGATPAEVAAAGSASAASRSPAGVAPGGLPKPAALADAIAGLAAGASSPIRTRVSWLAAAAGTGGAHVWWVVELGPALVAPGGELAGGAEIAATAASSSSGEVLGQRREMLPAGARVAVFDFAIPGPGGEGLVLRLRARPAGGGPPITETVRVPAAVDAWPVGTPRLLRQRPGPNSPFTPTADPRYARTERLRVEVPAAGAIEAVAGELLDRTGALLKLPVACSARAAAPGAASPGAVSQEDLAWAACDATLAPLAAGDYGIRVAVSVGGHRHEVVIAFRLQ